MIADPTHEHNTFPRTPPASGTPDQGTCTLLLAHLALLAGHSRASARLLASLTQLLKEYLHE